MDKYKINEIIKGVGVCYKDTYSQQKAGYEYRRSKNRKWDRIICVLCVGCGKPLSKYDNLNRHAYCIGCRKILFPRLLVKLNIWTIKERVSHQSG